MGTGANPGDRIRVLRKMRNMTLSQLSEATGLSVSHLSEMERGEAGASVTTLRKIVEVLGGSLADLLEGDRPGEVVVVRADGGKELTQNDGVTFRFLECPEKEEFVAGTIRFEPGAKTSLSTHLGMELIYVLQGEIDVYVGTEMHHLKSGDLMRYSATKPHGWDNNSSKTSLVLFVNLNFRSKGGGRM